MTSEEPRLTVLLTVEEVACRFNRSRRAAAADLLDTVATRGQAHRADAVYAA